MAWFNKQGIETTNPSHMYTLCITSRYIHTYIPSEPGGSIIEGIRIRIAIKNK